MRSHPEGALEVRSWVISRSLIDELIAADRDVTQVTVRVFPNAEDDLRVRSILRVQYADDVVDDLQPVIDRAAAGVVLQGDIGCEVCARADAISLNLDRIT